MPEGREPHKTQEVNFAQLISYALQLTMDHVVHPRIWEAVSKQIVERAVVHENTQITLSLEKRTGLADGQMLLCIDYNYELRSLKHRSVVFEIQHYLNDHIQCANNNLPGFEQIQLGTTDYSGKKLKDRIKNGVFSDSLSLEPHDEGSVPVRIRRREITYVPGSFSLVMNELCTGVRIDLERIPPGIVAHVRGPQATDLVRLDVGSPLNEFQDHILLPGQGFEFRFQREVANSETQRIIDTDPLPARYYLHILSPSAGANVQDGGWIKGTAKLPPNSFMWVFVGTSTSPSQWKPQGNGAVEIKDDRTWEVPACYGKVQETGNFIIVAIVVDETANRYLQRSYAEAEIAGKLIKLPLPVEDHLIRTITVEKTVIDLNRGRLERRSLPDRRGSVLAVKHDRRRISKDRRA